MIILRIFGIALLLFSLWLDLYGMLLGMARERNGSGQSGFVFIPILGYLTWTLIFYHRHPQFLLIVGGFLILNAMCELGVPILYSYWIHRSKE